MASAASTPQKALFDQSCLSIISYLETFDECSNIDFNGSLKATPREIDAWEKKNLPYKLPSDLSAFYQMFDGFSLSYNTDVSGVLVPVGMLCLNRLADLERVPIEGMFPGHSSTAGMTSAGFALDSLSEVGVTVLLYRSQEDRQAAAGAVRGSDLSSSSSSSGNAGGGGSGGSSYDSPEVWFQDRCARWHHLSANFSDFLRLMVMHVGVHGWQLAFAPEGLPPLTQQWMQLFARERLVMDVSGGGPVKKLDSERERDRNRGGGGREVNRGGVRRWRAGA